MPDPTPTEPEAALPEELEAAIRRECQSEVSERFFRRGAALALAHQERKVEALVKLVERAANDSCVTTSDGPGCFYCDHEEHTADCPASAALAELVKEQEGERDE